MKTAIVISDTHGNRRVLEELDGVFTESDYIIHLGDTSSDGNLLRGKYGEKCLLLNGNCDPINLGENELTFELEGVKIFATHGHLFSAKHTLTKLAARAKELGCTVALYGHTHRADERETDGVLCLNPGALSRYSSKSYLYLVATQGKLVTKIVPLQ